MSVPIQIKCWSCEELKEKNAALEAEAQALREEVAAASEREGILEHRLMRVMTRHFAEAWRKRDTDKTLEGYLSVGIAELERERDAALAEVAALRARVVVVLDWQPLTAVGQVETGDLLRFTVGGKEIEAPARLVIAPGDPKEEIVYNRGKNHYFITSMAVDGTSSHKGVMVKRLNGKAVSEGLLRETVRSVDDIFWAIHAKPSCQSGVVARCRCRLCAGTRLAMARDDLNALLGEGNEHE